MAAPAQATYDVAIVGYGPVGATFANLLSRHGLTVAVVERSLDIYDKPRAIVLDHEVLRVFQACGLTALLERAIAPHPGTQYLGVDSEIIFEFKMLSPPYPLGWTPNASFVQPDSNTPCEKSFLVALVPISFLARGLSDSIKIKIA